MGDYYSHTPEARRDYYKRNKDEINKRRREYRKEKLEKMREQGRKRYERKREIICEKNAEYRAANPERVAAMHKKYQEENEDRIKEMARVWRAVNKKLMRDNARKRYNTDPAYRARKVARACARVARYRKHRPKWQKLPEINKFYENCPDGYQVDHIIPINGENVSGLHVIKNLQYLTAEENMKKGNSYDAP